MMYLSRKKEKLCEQNGFMARVSCHAADVFLRRAFHSGNSIGLNNDYDFSAVGLDSAVKHKRLRDASI
jgi:hypothetical protein